MCRYDPTVDNLRVYSLSVHAEYACRHSGACCTAGWSIPVEVHLRGRIPAEWLHPVNGACPEYDRTVLRCRIHRSYGESALPESCVHFPRRALVDERGTFITLSHFCPTAASMLLDDSRPLHIVADPQAFPRDRHYDGLDARGDWPPLVRPDVLFDPPSFELWERFVVDTLATSSTGPETTLLTIAEAAERIRQWRLDAGPLLDWVAGAVQAQERTAVDLPPASVRTGSGDAYRLAQSCVPEGLTAEAMPDDLDARDAELVAPYWEAHAPLVLRYVAAKAFASWSAYQGRGVRTQVAEWWLSLGVLRVECVRAAGSLARALDRQVLHAAVRQADWLLMHLVDRSLLMHALGTVEHHATAGASA